MSNKHDSTDRKLLKYIFDYVIKNGMPPSSREIAVAFPNKVSGRPVSTNTVHAWIDRLVQLKWLKKLPKISRGISITETGREIIIEGAGQ
jgi:SOS-response transcriptional repressor LexA